MGGEQSQTNISALNDNLSKANKIQAQYFKKVFTQHKMSSVEFN